MRTLYVLVVILFFAGCSVGVLTGCSQPSTTTPDADQKLAAVQKKAASVPSVWKLLDTVVVLAKDALDELAKYAEKLGRRQELQATVKHWLIAGAIASGLFALLSGAGKFCGNVPAWYGVLLAWIAKQVRWRSIIIAAVVCAVCICGAIWLPIIWSFVIDALWIAGYAAAAFMGWELSCRYYTGEWAADGLVRLPKGWQVAPEAKG